jgi:transposase
MEVGIFMAKYSYEFKKKIVTEYLSGKGGYNYLAKVYGIPDKKSIRCWVQNYKKHGDEGLKRSRKNNNYTFERKLAIVETYLSSEISYIDLAIKEDILNPGLIVQWVNQFRIAGPNALRPRKKGRKKILDKKNKDIILHSSEDNTVDMSVEYIKELEDELLKLRIENAFLKELRRLRLEDEAKMRDLHESSTVSEDNSN